jgi:hypothetical protein
MGQTSMPKKDLGETPVISDINNTQTTGAFSNGNKISIGAVHISSTKKAQEDTVMDAVKKEYNDTNMSK